MAQAVRLLSWWLRVPDTCVPLDVAGASCPFWKLALELSSCLPDCTPHQGSHGLAQFHPPLGWRLVRSSRVKAHGWKTLWPPSLEMPSATTSEAKMPCRDSSAGLSQQEESWAWRGAAAGGLGIRDSDRTSHQASSRSPGNLSIPWSVESWVQSSPGAAGYGQPDLQPIQTPPMSLGETWAPAA